MKLLIKNMVCPRCISAVKQVTGMTPREFRELEIHRRTALDAL